MEIALVKMDDTEYWDQEVTKKTGRIYSYYIFNPNEHTHCCSLTPSLFLYPVAFETEKEIDDDTHGDVMTAWSMGTDADYFTCRIKPDETNNYFDSIKEAIEYYQGNQPWIPTTH